MTRKAAARIVLVLAALTLALVPAAVAGNGAGEKPVGGGGGSCTRKTPAVVVDNNWAWAAPGSYGLPGQQLTYAIDVVNYDSGCSSASFVVGVSTPSGFSVSLPTSTIKLRSGADLSHSLMRLADSSRNRFRSPAAKLSKGCQL